MKTIIHERLFSAHVLITSGHESKAAGKRTRREWFVNTFRSFEIESRVKYGDIATRQRARASMAQLTNMYATFTTTT